MSRLFSAERKLICIVLAMILSVLFITENRILPVYAETDKEQESTSDKIQKAEELKKITEEQRQVIEEKKDDLEEQREELEEFLLRLNGDLQELSDNIEVLEARMAVKQAEIDDARQKIDEALAREEEQYDFMKKRVKHIYENGVESALTRLFTSKNYTDFVNKSEYVNKMEAYDRKILDELREIRETVEENETRLRGDMDELRVLMDQAQEEQEKVTTLVSTTTGSIAATSGALSAAEMEQAAYEAELKAQNENLSSLKKQLAQERAMATKAAKMAWRDISEVSVHVGDRDLLAALIYCEAGGEPYVGQVAVGAVVMNRIRSAAYPNTMVGVIYQKGQFSPVASGRLATRLSIGANASCYQAADEAMAGSTPVGNCLYFRTVTPQINGQIIGGHVFY